MCAFCMRNTFHYALQISMWCIHLAVPIYGNVLEINYTIGCFITGLKNPFQKAALPQFVDVQTPRTLNFPVFGREKF